MNSLIFFNKKWLKHELYLAVCLVCIFMISSCGYRKPKKDRYPNMPHFPAYQSSNTKLSLLQLNTERESVEDIIVAENKLFVFSKIRADKSEMSSDSAVITIYNSFTDFKKYYYYNEQSLYFYDVKILGKDIYTNYYKLEYPNYEIKKSDFNKFPKQPDTGEVDKIDETKLIQYTFSKEDSAKMKTSIKHKEEDFFIEFDNVNNGNKQNSGKFSLPFVIQTHIHYYKIKIAQDSILFKIDDRPNGYFDLTSFTMFGKKIIFCNLGLYQNGNLFLLNENK